MTRPKMLSSPLLITTLFFFFLLSGSTTASPTSFITPRQEEEPEQDCAITTPLPSWTVTSFSSNTTDSVGSGGAMRLQLTHNHLAGKVDDLTCSLAVNYRCVITGTPSDADLVIHVGVRAGTLTLSLDKVVSCEGATT